MAKRVPAGEVPYRPLDKVLIQSVLAGVPEPEPASAQVVGGRSSAVAVLEPPSLVEPPRPHVANPPRPSVATLPTQSSPRRLELATASQDMGLERRDREKRVLLTRVEERDVERLVDRLAGELQTPVKLSHVLRASITILLHAEEELVERARKTTLMRPGNGNAPELAEFEHGVAQILAGAFREARPIR